MASDSSSDLSVLAACAEARLTWSPYFDTYFTHKEPNTRTFVSVDGTVYELPLGLSFTVTKYMVTLITDLHAFHLVANGKFVVTDAEYDSLPHHEVVYIKKT